jgi:hypothetical protein
MMLRLFLSLFLVASSAAFCPIAPTSSRTSSNTALGVAIDTSDIKNGMTVELDGEPYKVLSFSIMKQARGAAKTTIKFKNLVKGTTIENTYRSGEKFETAMIEKTAHQFTYEDGVSYIVLSHCIALSEYSGNLCRRIQERKTTNGCMFLTSACYLFLSV